MSAPLSVVLIEAQPCHLTRDAFSSREATTQIGLDFPFSFFPLKLLPRSADATAEGSEGLASEQTAARRRRDSGAKAKGEPLGVTRRATNRANIAIRLSDNCSLDGHLEIGC